VDPLSEDQIAYAIYQVLSNNELASKMAQEGLRNVRRFSWERTAREMLAIYREVSGNESP